MERYINRTIQGDIVIEAALVDGDKVTPIDLVKEGIKTVHDLNKSQIVINHMELTAQEAEDEATQRAVERKRLKVEFGISLIAGYDGFMESKGFDKEPRATRKAIKAILKPLYAELADGQLKDAIDEIKALTNPQFDGVYLRKSKMLKVRNDIHEFLGIPPALTYNE